MERREKRLIIFFLPLLLGLGFSPSLDYLSAFQEEEIWKQEGVVWEYNPISWYREVVQLPPAEIIDFFSDTSFQKFLDDDHGLSDEYRPEDIISLHSDFTANYSSNFQLRKEAGEQFADMARAFANAFSFKSKLSLTSAYRSPTYQKQLASTCSTQRCALPGTSEHEAGLALDLGVNGGNILGNQWQWYQWLQDNAHLYGFHNTYQKGVEIDGKVVEPWHWRYLGVELATYLYENNQTFAEYFYSIYPRS